MNIENELRKFDDYLRFGTDEETQKSETSRRAYCWTVSRFIEFLDNDKPTPDSGREFIKHLEDSGNSASSINRHIWALKSYFRFKGKKFNIRGLKPPDPTTHFLTDKEWATLLEVATAPIYDPKLPDHARYRALLERALLFSYCGAGLRCAEAVRLKREDILDDDVIRVVRKGGHTNFVPVERPVIEAITEFIAVCNGHGDDTYIFPGQDGHMAPRTAQGIVKKLCNKANLPNVHIHSLRHTAGYQLRRMGASERDIQDFLGHKSINSTKRYTQLRPQDLRKRLPKRFPNARQGTLL